MIVPVSYVPEAKATHSKSISIEVALPEATYIGDLKVYKFDNVEFADSDRLLEGYIEKTAEDLSGEDVDITDGKGTEDGSAIDHSSDGRISLKKAKKSAAGKALYGSYDENNTYMVKRGDLLDESNKQQYDGLAEGISRIASGLQESTRISIPLDVLQNIRIDSRDIHQGDDPIVVNNEFTADFVDELFLWANNYLYKEVRFNEVMDSLMYDCPYDLYWYDKTKGIRFGINLSDIGSYDGDEYHGTFFVSMISVTEFTVAKGYSKTDEKDTSEVNTEKNKSCEKCCHRSWQGSIGMQYKIKL